MKSHKDVLTAQSNKAASTVCTSQGDPGEPGTKVSMKAVFLSFYTFAQKNPPESLLLIYFHKCCISAYFQTAWLFCYIICLVVFAYLIIFHLFLKGLTWEAGRERRQRRAGKRCKHIADKMIVFGQLS